MDLELALADTAPRLRDFKDSMSLLRPHLAAYCFSSSRFIDSSIKRPHLDISIALPSSLHTTRQALIVFQTPCPPSPFLSLASSNSIVAQKSTRFQCRACLNCKAYSSPTIQWIHLVWWVQRLWLVVGSMTGKPLFNTKNLPEVDKMTLCPCLRVFDGLKSRASTEPS